MKPIKFLALTLIIMASLLNNKLNAQLNITKNKADRQAVLKVISKYKNAIESLDVNKTLNLFYKDSQVFESGGVEGNYANYLEHHLRPELNFFKSFKFNNYKADVQIDLPYAFVTETYVYEIVIKANPEKGRKERLITKKGVTTSVLKKREGKWKIFRIHSSSRDN